MTMVHPKKLKIFLKLTIIIIALVIFFKYFFIDITKNYTERLTARAYEDKPFESNEEGFKIPAITICPSPSKKSSVLAKYNITNSFFSLLDGTYEHLIDTKSLSDVSDEASFKLGEDFEIRIDEILISTTGIPLKLGTNYRTIYGKQTEVKVTAMETSNGLCYLLRSNLTLSLHEIGYALTIVKSNKSESETNEIDSMMFTLTSDADYMAAVIDIWKSLQPIRFRVKFTDSPNILDLKEKRVELIKNCDEKVDSFFSCFSRKVVNYPVKCPKKCTNDILKPFYDRVNAEYDICTNLTHDYCNIHGVVHFIQKLARDCKIQCKQTEYLGHPKEQDTSFSDIGQNGIELYLLTTQTSRDVIKEYPVYTTVDLIGTLGGSLGLFLGVSFYGILSDLIELFIKD